MKQMIYLFKEKVTANSTEEYFYNSTELVEYFLDEYTSKNQFKEQEKIGTKIALFYASILLNYIKTLDLNIKDTNSANSYLYFIIGRILMILGIPMYAEQYLKEAQRISTDREDLDVINGHLSEIRRRYSQKVNLYETFSSFSKDLEFNEFSKFDEIYEDVIEYLNTQLIYQLSLESEYSIVSQIILDTIEFKYKEINRNDKLSFFVNIKLELTCNLLDNNDFEPAIAQIVSLMNFFKKEDKEYINKVSEIINRYSLPVSLLNNNIDEESMFEIMLSLNKRNETPEEFNKLETEYYISLSVNFILHLLPNIIQEIDKENVNKEELLLMIFTVIYKSIKNCLIQKSYSISKIIEHPEKCLIDISQGLENSINQVKHNHTLYIFLTLLIKSARATSYLSRSISATEVLHQTSKSISDLARQDGKIAFNLAVKDNKSAILYTNHFMSSFLNEFKLNSKVNLFLKNKNYQLSYLPKDTPSKQQHKFDNAEDAVNYIQNIWAPKVKEIDEHQFQDFEFYSLYIQEALLFDISENTFEKIINNENLKTYHSIRPYINLFKIIYSGNENFLRDIEKLEI